MCDWLVDLSCDDEANDEPDDECGEDEENRAERDVALSFELCPLAVSQSLQLGALVFGFHCGGIVRTKMHIANSRV